MEVSENTFQGLFFQTHVLTEHTDTLAEIQNTLRAGIDFKLSGVEIVAK